MAITDRYPTTIDIPDGVEELYINQDIYSAISSYIEDLTTDLNKLLDSDGNFSLVNDTAYSSSTIKWDGDTQISIAVSHGYEYLYTSYIETDTIMYDCAATITNFSVETSVSAAADVVSSGAAATITVSGSIFGSVERKRQELSEAAEPADPASGKAVIWFSNGTGYGDAGDLVCKINVAATVKSYTISDYSTL